MPVRRNRVGQVAVLELDRPLAKNAIDRATLEELDAHLDEVTADDSVAALVLCARGDVFIAGGDLKELAELSPLEARDLAARMWRLLERFERAEFPTIAAIDGDAFGGGWEVALACDLRVMRSTAKLHFRQAALGLTPGWGGAQRLLRSVGYEQALLLLATAASITADEALSLGIVQRLVPAETSARELAINLGQQISLQSSAAVRLSKRALVAGRDQPSARATAIEHELFTRVFGSEEHRSRAARALRR